MSQICPIISLQRFDFKNSSRSKLSSLYDKISNHTNNDEWALTCHPGRHSSFSGHSSKPWQSKESGKQPRRWDGTRRFASQNRWNSGEMPETIAVTQTLKKGLQYNGLEVSPKYSRKRSSKATPRAAGASENGREGYSDRMNWIGSKYCKGERTTPNPNP